MMVSVMEMVLQCVGADDSSGPVCVRHDGPGCPVPFLLSLFKDCKNDRLRTNSALFSM